MMSIKTISFYVMAALLIAAVAAGIALLVGQNNSGNPGIQILLPTSTPTPELKVYISGAVVDPGVYVMKEGDRLTDAIAAAGGPARDAQLSCVNLALRMEDEAHFHVPGPDEQCQAASTTSTPTTGAGGKMDLNTATVEQLETLPGIGPVKARAIVDHRERHGPFQSAQEVVEVTGIGPATYEGIRDLVYTSSAVP